MKIAEFIRETILRPRLKKSGCLLVYDPDRRYRDICFGLGGEKVRIVDASESSIESREAAIRALREVGRSKTGLEGLLIYVPTRRPGNEKEKQVDPFAIYGECGAVFPENDGDEYLNLCLRARPDHATAIRQVFAVAPSGPSFEVIDAVGVGISWPQLRATLKVESAREILISLLAPSAAQSEALKSQEGWDQEARDFLRTTLAMEVKTRSKSWKTLADELWRYVLFSEFVFDLPGDLPESLRGVPRAPEEARPFINDVCAGLRRDPKFRDLYIDNAKAIEEEMKLPEACRAIEDLGELDTFPFEERTFLRIAIKGITDNDTDATRRMLERRKDSVWTGKGESQAQWSLVQAGLSLVEACEDFERQLPDRVRSLDDLIDFYLGSLREADRLHREFEQATGELIDHQDLMDEVVGQARARYRRLAEKVQVAFVKHLETSGWPPNGRLANAEVFDRLVGDRLKERGRRVAYLMVDALRYELGVVLEKMLAEDGPVELLAAFAQLPSITPVGMASLLPGAGSDLTFSLENGSLVPKLAGISAGSVPQRMDAFRKRFGDRFGEMLLSDFLRKKPKIEETVDLLVLRSTEIDNQLENSPETTLGLIPGTLKTIRVALHKLRTLGFHDAVIVTDHGFFLNAQAEAGDVCLKPQGNWPVNAHDRMMLGDGVGDSHNLVVSAQKVGIKGDFARVALPRSMAPYRSGHLYFHGGASLAEAVVPVIVTRLDAPVHPVTQKVVFELSYKNGSKRITTRLPVIDILMTSDDLFSQDTQVEILLEAQDAKGKVVGESRPGGEVNPATRTIWMTPGQRKQIALRMDEDFRGKFTVKALNPATEVAYCTLAIETDYTE